MRLLMIISLGLVLAGCSGLGLSLRAALEACADPTAITTTITEPLCLKAGLGGGELKEES